MSQPVDRMSDDLTSQRMPAAGEGEFVFEVRRVFLNRLLAVAVLLVWVTSGTGCATAGKKLSSQADQATKSAGVVYLTLKGTEWFQPQPVRPSRLMRRITPVNYRTVLTPVGPQKITVAKERYNAGPAMAKYVVPAYSGDMLIDSLRKQLSAAGYQVVLLEWLPRKVKNGLDLSLVDTDLERVSELLTLKGYCTMHVKLDLWQNGRKANSFDYAVHVADFAVLNQNSLLENIMMTSAQKVAKQAVPDIVHALAASRN